MPILKNLIKKDYDLFNIKNTKERPYFFGLGMPSRFNCNLGFDSKDEREYLLRSKENEESKIYEQYRSNFQNKSHLNDKHRFGFKKD